jgi:NADPH:quinone reductase-like Zn-dependent oxidoreductase
MKAVFIDRFGGPEVLTYGDQPDPVAGPGQVVVDVAAASVNGADWRVRAGQYAEAKFPLILGRDFSGTVSAAAADVHDLKVGDAVFGVLEAGREALMPKSSRSARQSSPKSPTRFHTSTRPRWRSPA